MSIIFSVLVQLVLAAHALKTGRSTYWVFIIALIPFLGCLLYIIVELVPEWLGSRTGLKLKKKIMHGVDSDNALKEALRNIEIADTVDNRTKLAAQYLRRNQFQEAKVLYDKCLTGINKTDPMIMLGLATADFGLNNYAQVITTLEDLKIANPDFKSQEGHLIYARSQEGVGDITAAINEYETLIQYYPTPEPTCRFALLLKAQGDIHRANQLFMKIIDYSKNAGRHYNDINDEWITMAKKETRD